MVFNLIQSFLFDSWHRLNFKEPWTSADYPTLCSVSTVKLLPWMVSDYPVLRSPDSNIRLLQLHPGNHLSGIEATLESRSFLEHPQYRALSYTWGDPSRVKPITVNGKRMDITENLWNALFYIRDTQRNQTLWVDAISINQKNNEEKSVQVPLMSFIYSRAKEVIVWLGDHKPPRWAEQASLSQWHGDWAVCKANEDWPVTKYWLYLLTQEEYFKRCWIVQEIAMAARIRVLSGKSSVPWHDFLQLVKLYKEKVPQARNAIDKVLKLETLRGAKYIDGRSYTLGNLLEQFSDCFCTETLDKVFAFVGIASDCIDTCITVDYTKSPVVVYHDLLAFWNSRCLRTGDEAAGTLRFAGLVRSILSRKSVLVPKLLDPPGIGQSADSIVYALCGGERAQYCHLVPSLRSLLATAEAIRGLFDRMLSYLARRRTDSKSLWLPSGPESSRTWLSQSPARSATNIIPVRARGIIAGVVCDLGPSYREFIERSSVQQRWASRLTSIWGLACNTTSMQSARAINERLTMLLGAAADYRMRNFVSLNSSRPYSFYSSRLFVAFGPQREVLMGLAPWETLPGDMLIQFWNTDAVLVAREYRDGEITIPIGRAGLIKNGGRMDWDVAKDRDAFEHSETAFDFYSDLSVLTRLSFDTVCLPGTSSLRLFDEQHWEEAKHLWTSHDFESNNVDVFGGIATGYDNDWDTGAMEHINEAGIEDFEHACFSTPCRRFCSDNTRGSLIVDTKTRGLLRL
jgi:Heterokaryon incompatibility protein (HET)